MDLEWEGLCQVAAGTYIKWMGKFAARSFGIKPWALRLYLILGETWVSFMPQFLPLGYKRDLTPKTQRPCKLVVERVGSRI